MIISQDCKKYIRNMYKQNKTKKSTKEYIKKRIRKLKTNSIKSISKNNKREYFQDLFIERWFKEYQT